MAKNDSLLIDGIIDELLSANNSNDRGKAFEDFAFEQILKDYDLSSEEIQLGNVDGGSDGGIDGFYIIVNGHFLSDLESFIWPRSGVELELWIITCKHQDTFKQAPLDNLAASVSELFDFSISNDGLSGDYSKAIISCRDNFRFAYRKTAPRLTKFTINYSYASRGNTLELGEQVIARSEQIKRVTSECFEGCNVDFFFTGANELVSKYRKLRNFSLELPFQKDMSIGSETFALLVKLEDYYRFVSENGVLRRYLFDSNVRDFMGLNRVNEDIRDTLNSQDSPNFWWLNNGVTILATSAVNIGSSIQMEDIQIVNGLQTTESVFRHFTNGGQDINNRSILIKIITSKDERIRDTIIRATNNQTSVELSSLHATDKIQRDIEDVLKRYDLYYERRINFYKNQDIPPNLIITPLYLAAAYTNLILKSPMQATNLKSRFMRSQPSYERVFSESTDLKVWPKVAIILRETDLFLNKMRPSVKASGEKFLKHKRHFISFFAISKILGTFHFTVRDLVEFDVKRLTESEFQFIWNLILELALQDKNKKISRSEFLLICEKLENIWSVVGLERLSKENSVGFNLMSKDDQNRKWNGGVSQNFAMKVNQLLPPQPWKPGVHLSILEALSCSKKEYYDAVAFLIDEGLRYVQKDGVVYDSDGNVIMFDEERVDSTTLKLIQN